MDVLLYGLDTVLDYNNSDQKGLLLELNLINRTYTFKRKEIIIG